MANTVIVIEKIQELKNEYVNEILEKLQVIKNLSDAVSFTDLKIHTINYELWKKGNELGFSEKNIEDLFNFICDMEYESFQEWEHENLHYVEREYIGHTSSFYYMSEWYGNSINNLMVRDALKGQWTYTNDVIFGDIESNVVNALLKNEIPKFENEDELLDFLNLMSDEEDNLSQLLDDLYIMIEILEEANKAYDYLNDYKLEENQIRLAIDYLDDHIENFEFESKSINLFDSLLKYNSNKLNEINTIKTLLIESENNYIIEVEINNQLIFLDTEIKVDAELGKKLVELVHQHLIEIIDSKFTLR